MSTRHRRSDDRTASDEYDLIVIGGGPVGENIADRAVTGGLQVALVESELVGGECSYWACMPSKALLRSGQALRAAQSVPGAAQAVTGRLDVDAVLARRTEYTSDWSDEGQVDWLTQAHIELHRGHGRLTGERTVSVTAPEGTVSVLTARHAVAVATGSAALIPDIDGLRGVRPWTNREATAVTTPPRSLVILGGGVVGAELATAFTDLGTAVTVLARSTLLASMEPEAGRAVADSLRGRGADIRERATVSSVRRLDGSVTVRLASGDEIVADEILVATGRRPRSDDLGLDAVGLTPGDWLPTDDTLRVDGVPWLYAAGDVTGRALLTHQGKYQARAAGDAIAARAAGSPVDAAAWGRHVATADHSAVPQVVFSDPEVALVGLTAAAARERGMDVAVVDVELGSVAGAALREEGARGLARAVIDRDAGVIRGMTLIGSDVAELLHAATVAVVGEVPIARLWHAVPAYPTASELWLRILEGYGRESA
ncbi:MAG: dihydrolipoyl dehydrogenase family protein [Mycetocola reblochoni]|uniref:PF00070 family, FAD-dependent NAD(P)-disulphide oxidoreductase n=2 Tax=Mycetocola reblochoni TaxID=331618 RepID=A0A1R4IJ34_9MICO|nr:NAD(P)/FAD-dependent oxidoreductase [Mycetocola reblochoni]RLP69671.1 NAD(P)/FAD-dependent oxidoreductase [Mycetocola reblochoni]SJN19807.1 PF00070 family, FAD-dependent NAD(P)-disulphide oxidoreductase [Mycetocola reblochoni REB411]